MEIMFESLTSRSNAKKNGIYREIDKSPDRMVKIRLKIAAMYPCIILLDCFIVHYF